jgi:hypothetical protein
MRRRREEERAERQKRKAGRVAAKGITLW